MRDNAQAPAPQALLWTTEVVPQLPADLELQAYELKAGSRKRKLASATDERSGLLAYVLVATSFRHLGSRAVVINLGNLSTTAPHKRLRASSPWLLWLQGELLAPPSPEPCLRLFPQADGSNILFLDATRLKRRGGTGDDWLKHTAYNLTAGRLVQVTVTTRSRWRALGLLSSPTGRHCSSR